MMVLSVDVRMPKEPSQVIPSFPYVRILFFRYHCDVA